MGKFKQLAIEQAEREFEAAHEEWLQRRHDEEINGAAEQLDILEHQSFRPDKPCLGIFNAGSDD